MAEQSSDSLLSVRSLRVVLPVRGHLLDIAYRMLGSYSDAEDVVQEAFIRLLRVPEPDDPRGWMAAVVSRLCIDRLRAADRHTAYVGPWLPEPVAAAPNADDPADRVTLDDSVAFALLVVLEQLSPAERAAFVLHDVFAVPFEELAAIVGRSPAACRQLASRARKRVRVQGYKRFRADPEEHRRVVQRFVAACDTGNLKELAELLDPDVVLVNDGGGVVPSARLPICGQVRVARVLCRGLQVYAGGQLSVRSINGQPGVAFLQGDSLAAVGALSVRGGAIDRIYALANPAKLAQVASAWELPLAAMTHHRHRDDL